MHEIAAIGRIERYGKESEEVALASGTTFNGEGDSWHVNRPDYLSFLRMRMWALPAGK
jgi:hypothetical protein